MNRPLGRRALDRECALDALGVGVTLIPHDGGGGDGVLGRLPAHVFHADQPQLVVCRATILGLGAYGQVDPVG